jgi:hypothetical protein
MKRWICFTFVGLLAVMQGLPAWAAQEEAIRALQEEIQALREQVDAQRQIYEQRLKEMQQRIDAVGASQAERPALKAYGEQPTGSAEQTQKQTQWPQKAWSSVKGTVQRLNPDISVIIDTNYANSDRNDTNELYEAVAGFGHSDEGEDEQGHSHERYDEGFNLREAELFFSADVDPYFKGYTTIAFHSDDVDLEEAVIQTTFLPAGLQAKGIKLILLEPFYGRKPADLVAGKTGAKAIVCPNSVAGDPEAADYLALIDLIIKRVSSAL